jgi:hypothetical protein
MFEPNWLALELKTSKIPAKPEPNGLWTLVHPYVRGPAKLRIEAKGSWKYCESGECGPDGSRQQNFSDQRLSASAPLGALIGKIGGSPADKPGTNAFAFVAGTYTVVVLEDKTEGPLFLTMNDEVKHFDDHSGSVEVTISHARSG